MNTHRRHPNRGFAFIELPLAIAILALLAAILFPVFAKAREKSRQNICLTNLRQAGQALRQYAQDYDDHLPVALDDPLPAPVQGSALRPLSDVLSPYIADLEIWHCRADHGLSDSTRPSTFTVLGSSYLYRGEPARHGQTLTSLPRTSFLLADAAAWHFHNRRNVLFTAGNARLLPPEDFSSAWTMQPTEQTRVESVTP